MDIGGIKLILNDSHKNNKIKNNALQLLMMVCHVLNTINSILFNRYSLQKNSRFFSNINVT